MGVDLDLHPERPGFGLFLGAGASREAGYPLMSELTQKVLGRLRHDSIRLVTDVMSRAVDDAWDPATASDLEEIADHLEAEALTLGRNTARGRATYDVLSEIYELIWREIRSVRPDTSHHVKLFQALRKLRHGLSQPIWVFTTNYDTLVELAAAQCQLPILDGFVGSYPRFFHPASYRWHFGNLVPQGKQLAFDDRGVGPYVVLFKLHGSVNWWMVEGQTPSLFLAEDHTVLGRPASRTLVAPRKGKVRQVLDFPYSQIWRSAADVIGFQCKYLVTCGYSFRDEHINETILIGPAKENRIRLVALAPEKLSIFDELTSIPAASWATANEVWHRGTKAATGTTLWRFSSLVDHLAEQAGLKEA